ncbi:hypothetical protein [Mucilaginibacter paludis]|uniref:DUF4230 domain-containing protein n=1 Tax=Mucilaginibacter paludis DSM 18603 TaxID=714943 RepID=H1YD08_9SPHI|nr:hypothetical protein [Mucilaginibacter paludis]EHQ26065.1 hypothetical protein Mucpa_1918 [Mucilaginibacter paludis DSM 18603]
MHIRKRYILILAIIAAVVAWFLHLKAIETAEERQYNFSLQQLRGVTKLVIWEQDFLMSNLESQERTYFQMFTTKESVSTTVFGKIGFHINLADSVNTIIERNKDTIIVKAPLQITYVSLDLGTLQQVKEASIDPFVKVDKNEVIKHLNHKALEKYLPGAISVLKNRSLADQQKQLTRLVGKPVKIILTRMPKASDWK